MDVDDARDGIESSRCEPAAGGRPAGGRPAVIANAVGRSGVRRLRPRREGRRDPGGPPVSRGRLAWAIAIVDIVAILIVSVVDPNLDGASGLLYAVGIASFVLVGALLRSRVPDNPIGGLLIIAGTLLVVSVSIGTYSDLAVLRTPPWPAASLARTIGDATFIYPFAIAFIGIPLVFPDGHLPSPRFRWVAWLAIADGVAWASGALLSTPTDGFVLIATIVSFSGAMIAVGLRFRHGNAVERQQVKWPLATAGLGVLALAGSLFTVEVSPDLSNAFDIVGILVFFALPVVIGTAILRYRLYEIDRIVSRTIGYGLVTGVLVIVFAGAVIAFEAILAGVTDTGGETLAVAGSTLLAFALFQPLRRRVQRAVDRRFDRSRYDGERTSAAFSPNACAMRSTWPRSPPISMPPSGVSWHRPR